MDASQVTQWAKTLTAEVDKIWGEHSSLKDGYAVFYSPVIKDPKLLIVGFNPGGDSSSFNQQRACQVPEHHEYLTEGYAIAKKMRLLFEAIEESNALEHSVKTNLLFFRSPSFSHWQKIESQTRRKLEQFCASKVKEMVAVLQPRFILAEGIKTYNHLRNLLSFESEERVIKSKNRTLVVSTKRADLVLLGIIHPTGARISNVEWEVIRAELKKCLRKAI
jgi:hypothetical protein